jgi:hypothetical protein
MKMPHKSTRKSRNSDSLQIHGKSNYILSTLVFFVLKDSVTVNGISTVQPTLPKASLINCNDIFVQVATFLAILTIIFSIINVPVAVEFFVSFMINDYLLLLKETINVKEVQT